MEDQLNSDNSILDVIANVTDGWKASVKKRFKKYNLKIIDRGEIMKLKISKANEEITTVIVNEDG